MSTTPVFAGAAFALATTHPDRPALRRMANVLGTIWRVVAFLPRTTLAIRQIGLLVEEERRVEHQDPVRAAQLRREVQAIIDSIA